MARPLQQPAESAPLPPPVVSKRRPSLLAIRIDVDRNHGRSTLHPRHAAVVGVDDDPLAVAAAIEAVRARLHAALADAYPGARLAVVAQHGRMAARPTRVHRVYAKPLVPTGEAECVHVAEHADSLRAEAIAAVAAVTAANRHAAALDAGVAAVDVRAWAPPRSVAAVPTPTR